MNHTLLSLALVICLSSVFGQTSTMDFSGGASQSGYNFTSWSSVGGILFMTNLAGTSRIIESAGTWDLVSFSTAPFGTSGNFQATSDLGHSYTFNPNSGGAATHTLNWGGITTLSITRLNPAAGSFDFDNVVYREIPLPAQFSSFTAVAVGEEIMLDWTVQENGTEDMYQVEWSNNGEDFSSLGELSALGKSGESVTYHWAYAHAHSGKNYFRIKQVDFDGVYTYSSVIEVNRDIHIHLKCWPNPVTDNLQVEGMAGRLTLYNAAGQIVLEHPIGSLKETLELQQVPAGLYHLNIVNKLGVRVVERIQKR